MAHYPDFSDSDSDFSDDLDYADFKARTKQLNVGRPVPRILSDKEKKDQQLKSFFIALSSGNLNSVCEQLNSGLDVNIDVQDGWTPLLLGASFGNPELTAELLRRGADVNSQRDGCTALMMVCNCPNNTSPFTKSLEVIKQLVEHGANVKAINRKRMTALMFAANIGNLEAVKYLLPLSDRDAQDNQKWTALFWAVNNNEAGVVRYLLGEGFDTNITDVRNNTPLDIAKNSDFQKIVELFPGDEEDVLASIIESHSCSFEDTFKDLKPGERPKFFLDVCNFLCGLKNESLVTTFSDKDVGLLEFLSITDDELKEMGVKLPYQRDRIMGGLYRFHKHPFSPKSLHVVPLEQPYSNVDMARQLLSALKQVMAMEASLKFIMKNYDPDDNEDDLDLIKESVENVRNRIKLCKFVVAQLGDKANMLDGQVKPVDLITAKSHTYKVPWRKIAFSLSVVSLIVVYRIWK